MMTTIMIRETGTIHTALAGATALLRGASSSPQRDAELLLAHVLKRTREDLIAHRDDALTSKDARAFTALIRRRAEGIPLPYIAGRIEFYGREFFVTPAVLIPRPETEAIVAEALRLLDATDPLHPIIADIGTGSGVIAVSIAAETPRTTVVAADRSAAALAVARRNAKRHRVHHRVTLIESDLLSEFPPELHPQMLIANLPYVPADELKRAGDALDTKGLTFEPPEALDGGPDGLFVIRRLFSQLQRANTRPVPRSFSEEGHPTPDTLRHLILEHSPQQQRPIVELAHTALPNFLPHEVSPFVTSWSRK